MKTNRILTVVFSAFMMMGLGMGVASCSDSDKNEPGPGGGENEPQVENEQEELGWSLISQLTDERIAPAEWTDKTFEPTIGEALEGEPYTRVVSTNDVETAAARFAELAGNPAGFSEVMSGYSYSVEGMGTLTYKRGSETEPYLAQVDVDLKQVPHLKKILYLTPAQQGNNSVEATAYYRFGDVVKDGEGSYWVCVRPSFDPEGKGDSHWITVSTPLPDKNVYHWRGNNNDYYLPTGLGKSLEHMQNLCEMLYAMNYPDDWLSNLSSSPRPKFFHDFSFTKNYKYHNIHFWKRVAKMWDENNQDLYAKVFKCTKEQLKAAMDDPDKGLNFVYNGYSWKTGWNGGVYHAQFTNGTGKESNMHKVKDDGAVKKNLKDMPVDFRNGPDPNFFNDGRLRFVLRYKTGKQLSSNGRYDKKTAISGVENVYVYNKSYLVDLNDKPEVTTEDKVFKNRGFYVIGDVVKDGFDNRWICVMPSANNSDHPDSKYAYFVSFDEKALGKNLYSGFPNLPSKNLSMQMLFCMEIIAHNCTTGTNTYMQAIENVKNHAGVNMFDIVAFRDTMHKFTDTPKAESVINSFISSLYYDTDGTLCVLRLVGDYTAEQQKGGRDFSWHFYDSYTHDLQTHPKRMDFNGLADIADILAYNEDRWVLLPWWTIGTKERTPSPGYLKKTQRLDNLYNFLYAPNRSFLEGTCPTNMYREPLVVFAAKRVLDTGTEARAFEDGTRIKKLSLLSELDPDLFDDNDVINRFIMDVYAKTKYQMFLNDKSYDWGMNNEK